MPAVNAAIPVAVGTHSQLHCCIAASAHSNINLEAIVSAMFRPMFRLPWLPARRHLCASSPAPCSNSQIATPSSHRSSWLELTVSGLTKLLQSGSRSLVAAARTQTVRQIEVAEVFHLLHRAMRVPQAQLMADHQTGDLPAARDTRPQSAWANPAGAASMSGWPSGHIGATAGRRIRDCLAMSISLGSRCFRNTTERTNCSRQFGEAVESAVLHGSFVPVLPANVNTPQAG